MIQVKHGSKPFGLKAVMLKPWRYYCVLCQACGISPVITSAVREPGERYSLHQDGYAMDVRLRDLPLEQGRGFALALQKYLGNDYDVIYYPDTHKHLHIEYQKYLDDKKEMVLTGQVVHYVD